MVEGCCEVAGGQVVKLGPTDALLDFLSLSADAESNGEVRERLIRSLLKLPRAGLDAVWSRLRTELGLLAEGASTSFEANTAHGKPESRPLYRYGGKDSPATFDARWDSARSRKARAEITVDLMCCLRRYLLVPDEPWKRVSGQPNTKEWRQAIACDQRPCRAVAAIYGVSKSTVARYRQEFRIEVR